jgi:hypothetical protein
LHINILNIEIKLYIKFIITVIYFKTKFNLHFALLYSRMFINLLYYIYILKVVIYKEYLKYKKKKRFTLYVLTDIDRKKY